MDKFNKEKRRIRRGAKDARKRGVIVGDEGVFRVKFTNQKTRKLYGVSKPTLKRMHERHKKKLLQQEWDHKHHQKRIKTFFK